MDTELTKRNNNTSEVKLFLGNNLDDLKEENFKKSHNSIISKLFYGFLEITIQCLNCKYQNITYNVCYYILFPLEKVYNSLNKQNNNNNYVNNKDYSRGNLGTFNHPNTLIPNTRRLNINGPPKLDLNICFDDFVSEKLLTGNDAIYCNHCQKICEGKVQIKYIKHQKFLL